jgi:hypothetical protein
MENETSKLQPPSSRETSNLKHKNTSAGYAD